MGRSFQIVVAAGGGGAAALGQKKTAEKGLEVSVEHLVHVAYFHFGAVVLGHAVGLQDVRADLRAEVDVELGVFELLGFGALLFELVFVEARAQHLHRLLAVLVLRALVLALHHDAGGNVRHAHGGVGGVDVLAALAAGAVGVDAEVFELDVDVNGLVDFRRDEDGGERCVAALGGIEGRDADEAVDAALAGEQAEGVFAGDGEGGGLDAGLSPSWSSFISVLKPCCSAQRRYMRTSISAQSWLRCRRRRDGR